MVEEKRIRRKFERDSVHYIDKEEYNKELTGYHESGKSSERLGELFVIHVKRYASSAKFKNYTYRDEMEAEALWFLLKYAGKNWNVLKQEGAGKKPDAFAYCTQIIHNAFLQIIEREKTHSTIKDGLIKNQDRSNYDDLKYNILSQLGDD
jgi:hypothetical protein